MAQNWFTGDWGNANNYAPFGGSSAPLDMSWNTLGLDHGKYGLMANFPGLVRGLSDASSFQPYRSSMVRRGLGNLSSGNMLANNETMRRRALARNIASARARKAQAAAFGIPQGSSVSMGFDQDARNEANRGAAQADASTFSPEGMSAANQAAMSLINFGQDVPALRNWATLNGGTAPIQAQLDAESNSGGIFGEIMGSLLPIAMQGFGGGKKDKSKDWIKDIWRFM